MRGISSIRPLQAHRGEDRYRIVTQGKATFDLANEAPALAGEDFSSDFIEIFGGEDGGRLLKPVTI